jgi:hypothetical protein
MQRSRQRPLFNQPTGVPEPWRAWRDVSWRGVLSVERRASGPRACSPARPQNVAAEWLTDVTGERDLPAVTGGTRCFERALPQRLPQTSHLATEADAGGDQQQRTTSRQAKNGRVDELIG